VDVDAEAFLGHRARKFLGEPLVVIHGNPPKALR